MNRAIPLARPRRGTLSTARSLWLFAGSHAVLALALRIYPLLATFHALGVLVLGLQSALISRHPRRAVYFAAYIAAADVLWRMTGASVFWEYGKYASSLLLLLTWLRIKSRRSFGPAMVLYFSLLLPSCILTINALGLNESSRGAISFNLSGPFTLAVSVALFSGLDVRSIRLDRLLQVILLPIIGVLSLAAFSTLTAREIDFTPDSNLITSGHFGPNQVSTLLGLGILISFLLAINTRDVFLRWTYLAFGMGFLVQALLTFSRGGMLNATVGLAILSVHYVRRRRLRQVLLSILFSFAFFGSQFLLPQLNRLTGGTLKERYSSLDTTGRHEVVLSDIDIWQDNLLLGVGPGRAANHRVGLGHIRGIAPHTEYSRLMAEHGLLGVTALLILLVTAVQAYRMAPGPIAKSWVAALSGWAFAAMTHAAIRIATIPFLIGLATIQWPETNRPQRR